MTLNQGFTWTSSLAVLSFHVPAHAALAAAAAAAIDFATPVPSSAGDSHVHWRRVLCGAPASVADKVVDLVVDEDVCQAVEHAVIYQGEAVFQPIRTSGPEQFSMFIVHSWYKICFALT